MLSRTVIGMTGVFNSFLECRRAELLTDEHTVSASHDELKEQARECLPKDPYNYLASGAGSERIIQKNRVAFRRYQIVSCILRDVSDRSLGKLYSAMTAPLRSF